MRTATDMLGRTVNIPDSPERIISLVPSQSELLYDLKLNEKVAGITKFCIHPDEWFRTKTRVGGTRKLNLEKIKSLHPDLIIANKEENTKEQVEALAKDFPVWISDIKTFEDALSMIEQIGSLCNRVSESEKLIHEIKKRFSALSKPPLKRYRACYLIWKNPLMTVNRHTFIHDMMGKCGFVNVFADDSSRYPRTGFDELRDRNTEVLMLSSEPFPFSENHGSEFKKELPGCRIILVDGEMFSWYGSRMLQAPEYFRQLPDLIQRYHP